MFMSHYSAGKESGLQSIDAARNRSTYGAYQYKVKRSRSVRSCAVWLNVMMLHASVPLTGAHMARTSAR